MNWRKRTSNVSPRAAERESICSGLSIPGIIGWFQRAPYRGYHTIGTALQWMSSEKIVLGFDLPFDDLGRIIDYIRDMDMPAELQEKWGYPQLTQQDKANILGLNLARLTGIEPKKRAPLR